MSHNYSTMHTTPARRKMQDLKAEAATLEREARILQKVRLMAPGARERADEAARLRAKAATLEMTARLEDLNVWEMPITKINKKTGQAVTYTYWAASWRKNGKVRNVNLGSTRRIGRDEAMEKAKAMKRKALGI